MVPSATFSAPSEVPSLAAAADSRISRASAQANRNAVPLCSTDRLPAVCPSSGVSAVSPWTMAMRFRSRSSSSAAICDSAVPMPWPSSILPLKMVTLPFGSMRSHASSRRLLLRLPGRRAGETCGRASSGARLKPMTRAPLGTHDAIVRGAAAQVAVQRPPDLACRRGRIALEQRLCRHHHAVAAVAALTGLLLDERALQRVQLVERAEAFDGGDRLLDGRHRSYA